MSKYPTISVQADIDEKAQGILKRILAGNFIVRDYKPDIGLDYHVERRENNEPTAERVFIQLKGQASLKSGAEFGKVQFKRKTLKCYDEKEKEPVFIVLVDVKAERAFYLFAQPWITAHRDELKLDSSGRVTVSVPLKNELGNVPKFIRDCAEAQKIMRERYPGSPEAALANFVQTYASLDPRFGVHGTVTSKGRELHITAKRPTSVKFEIASSAEGIRQLQETFRYGRPASIKALGVRAEGSNLFEFLLDGKKVVGLELRTGNPLECELELSCEAPNHSFTFRIPARMTRGLKGVSYRTMAGDSPVQLEGEIESDTRPGAVQGARLNIQLAKWEGLPVLTLPWVNGVVGFIRAFGAQCRIKVALVHKENVLFKSSITPGRSESGDDHVRWVDMVAMIRDVAAATSLNPRLPNLAELPSDAIRQICDAYSLIKGGALKIGSISFLVSKERDTKLWDDILPRLRTDGCCVVSFFSAFPFEFNFLGLEASLGELRLEPGPVLFRPTENTDLNGEEISVDVSALDGQGLAFKRSVGALEPNQVHPE